MFRDLIVYLGSRHLNGGDGLFHSAETGNLIECPDAIRTLPFTMRDLWVLSGELFEDSEIIRRATCQNIWMRNTEKFGQSSRPVACKHSEAGGCLQSAHELGLSASIPIMCHIASLAFGDSLLWN